MDLPLSSDPEAVSPGATNLSAPDLVTRIRGGRSSIGQVLAACQAARRIVVSGHARPDGDALGAALALGRLLGGPGRTVCVAGCREELGTPGFLEGCESLVPPAVAAVSGCDLLVVVDCGAADRLPEPLRALAGSINTVNIDHHRTNTRFGLHNWIDARASSAGEMVWRLARQAGWQLDRAAAEALWVAVITDTGRFAYEQTCPATLRCAADLLRHGVRTAFINDQLYGQFEPRVLELRRRAHNSLEILNEGQVATVTLCARDFAETGSTKSDADDVIEIPRAVRGNRVALFFYESGREPNVTRLSIRTRAPLDATWLAMRYGGGGHQRAAGCDLPWPLTQARAAMRTVIAEWLAQTVQTDISLPKPRMETPNPSEMTQQ